MPRGMLDAQFLVQILMPDDLAGGRFEADGIAVFAECINRVAVNRRCRTRPAVMLLLLQRAGIGRLPYFLARGGIQTIKKVVIVDIAGGVNLAVAYGHRCESGSKRIFPKHLRAFFGPGCRPAGFTGYSVIIGSTIVGPVRRMSDTENNRRYTESED